MILKICLHAATMQSPPLLRGRAMAVAVHHAEIFLPGPGCFTNLVGHDARDLVGMIQGVGGPRGKQIRQRDCAERWAVSGLAEIIGGKVQSAQIIKAASAHIREVVEKLTQ